MPTNEDEGLTDYELVEGFMQLCEDDATNAALARILAKARAADAITPTPLPNPGRLLVESNGKRFAVRGIWPDTDDGVQAVNRYCEGNRDAGVIATAGGLIYVAALAAER